MQNSLSAPCLLKLCKIQWLAVCTLFYALEWVTDEIKYFKPVRHLFLDCDHCLDPALLWWCRESVLEVITERNPILPIPVELVVSCKRTLFSSTIIKFQNVIFSLLISLRWTLQQCVRIFLNNDVYTGVLKAMYTFSYTPFHYEVVKSHNLLESKIYVSEYYVICTKHISKSSNTLLEKFFFFFFFVKR